MRSLTVIPLVIALLFTGCGKAATPLPDTVAVPEEVVAEKVVSSLIELNDNAMHEIASEIADLDKKIAEIEEQEVDLHAIKSKVDREITASEEFVSEQAERMGWYWTWSMPEENLKYFGNKCYELVKLELVYTGAEGEHFDDIAIRDKETGDTGTPESFEADLHAYKSAHVNRKTAKLRVQEEANQILSDVFESKDVWKVSEIDNGIYAITGYGLGYTEQLSIGEWYYYESGKTIEPISPASIKLRDAITANTYGIPTTALPAEASPIEQPAPPAEFKLSNLQAVPFPEGDPEGGENLYFIDVDVENIGGLKGIYQPVSKMDGEEIYDFEQKIELYPGEVQRVRLMGASTEVVSQLFRFYEGEKEQEQHVISVDGLSVTVTFTRPQEE